MSDWLTPIARANSTSDKERFFRFWLSNSPNVLGAGEGLKMTPPWSGFFRNLASTTLVSAAGRAGGRAAGAIDLSTVTDALSPMVVFATTLGEKAWDIKRENCWGWLQGATPETGVIDATAASGSIVRQRTSRQAMTRGNDFGILTLNFRGYPPDTKSAKRPYFSGLWSYEIQGTRKAAYFHAGDEMLPY